MMKIPKELDEKLRAYLKMTEMPLIYTKQSLIEKNVTMFNFCIQALQLRKEIIELIDTKPIEGRYKQLDIEEEIEKVKTKNEYY